MTRLIAGMVRQRAAVILFAILALGGGVVAVRAINVELFPNVSFGTITAITSYPGASPDRVANDVTVPVENAVAGLSGITKLTSVSYEGLSEVVLQYDYGTDLDKAESKINGALAGIALPQGAGTPHVQQIDFSSFPVQIYSLRGLPLQTMDTIARGDIVPALTKLDGVAAADLSGIGKPEVRVVLDPAKLRRYGLTTSAVAQAFQGSNIALPAGDVTSGSRTIPIEVRTRLTTLSAIKNLPIAAVPVASMAGGAAGRGAYPGGTGGYAGAGSATGSNGGSASSAGGAGYNPTGGATGGAGTAGRSGGPGATGGAPSNGLSGAAGGPSVPASGGGSIGGASARAASAPRTRLVRLKDVATVTADTPSGASVISTNPNASSGIVRTNGQPSLALAVRKNLGANIVSVSDAIIGQVNSVVRSHPGLHADTIYDGSASVRDSLSSLVREGLLGAVFAVLVIFLFLRSVRTTLVTAVSIPLSILVALLLLARAGYTLNIMTLGAIAIAVGRVVDDSIVVLENIFRHAQQGEDHTTAVVQGTREVATAIIGSTITTVAVFLPIGFIGGILGQFFQPFALTVTFALLTSLVVALTVVPALASLFLRVRPRERRETTLQRTYTGALSWSLGHRAITLGLSALLLVGSLAAAVTLPKSFLGNASDPEISATLTLPAGASINATQSAVERLEPIIEHQPLVQTNQAIIGYNENGGGGGRNATNVATFTIRYRGAPDMDKAIARLNADTKGQIPGGSTFVAQKVATGPPNQGVTEFVSADDPATLRRAAALVENTVKGIKGVTNVQSDLATAKPQYYVDVKAANAARLGLSPIAVGSIVRGDVSAQSLGTVRLGGDTVDRDVNLTLPSSYVDNVNRLKSLPIAPGVTLSAVANVYKGSGPVQILRYSQRNTATISGDIVGGNSGAVSQQAASTVNRLKLPVGATIETAGIYKEFVQGFINMGIALLVAVVLVYLVMVIIFRSLIHPLTILFSLPLAVIGAVGGLLLTHREIDLSAGIGMLMLVGIVVTNAIVLLDLVLHLRARGMDTRDALVQAGRTRVRPILMTATATILALLPLALGINNGNTIIAANLATVVIGGLLTSTLLTLVVVPIIYSLFESLRDRGNRRGANRATIDRDIAGAVETRPASMSGVAR